MLDNRGPSSQKVENRWSVCKVRGGYIRVSGLLPTQRVNSASISVKHCQQCQGQSQMGDVRIDTLPEITFALQRREVTEENNGVVNSWQRVEGRH